MGWNNPKVPWQRAGTGAVRQTAAAGPWTAARWSVVTAGSRTVR